MTKYSRVNGAPPTLKTRASACLWPGSRSFLRGARVAALGAVVGAFSACSPPDDAPAAAFPPPSPIPVEFAGGKALFEANCASCHGELAGGTTIGPPLVHIIYEPNHHADAAFVLAGKNGVVQHHWNFGDMPPQPQVTDDQMSAIVGYVRWMQRQAGVY